MIDYKHLKHVEDIFVDDEVVSAKYLLAARTLYDTQAPYQQDYMLTIDVNNHQVRNIETIEDKDNNKTSQVSFLCKNRLVLLMYEKGIIYDI
ncbi:hypothetical protein [Staphylococcus intermedius]|uniref:Uncharacterized protein n=1 Tax=Staphylococcus intermedius NCTC 11048 TaxID=1141106 RepID=A0A380G7E7_STAIN|nr:hypothetical protein [Staphylococcus intermedius]PCF87408.1 hypothetical protein B4W76_03190 [Staphylococcus intermedius]PNZ52241.1 hypothetical protein CD138_06960 [Staphylococcus intermedius NCTC 11048]SUM47069.1 Uncharacterised protein [Staphylococcus intermedius NCTC 11048]